MTDPDESPFERVEPTPKEIEKMSSRMRALIQFLELNNIDPNEAVPMAMRFIACTCNKYIERDQLLRMFKIMVDDVYDA